MTPTSVRPTQQTDPSRDGLQAPCDDPAVHRIETLARCRTKTLVLPPDLRDQYNRETWPSRSRELIAWCLAVALMDAVCMMLDFVTLTNPALQWILIGRLVILFSFLAAIQFLRRSWAFGREGIILFIPIQILTLIAGVTAMAAAPELLERLLTNALFVGATGIALLRIDFRHTVATTTVTLAIVIGFLCLSQRHSFAETASVVAFYVPGAVALLRARQLNNRIQHRLFVLGLSERIKVAKVVELNARLRAMARTDPLTGIGNRRFFDEALDELGAGERADEPLGLLMIDIDYFKKLNDVLGHGRGDDCLQAVAASLSDALRDERALLTRFGGEEFVVLLPGCALEEAAATAERLRAAIYDVDLPHPGSLQKRVTVSIGVAARPLVPTGELVRCADEALYQAKQLGRDRIFVYETLAWGQVRPEAA